MGRRPMIFASGFVMNTPWPMVRISHAVDCAKTSISMLRSLATWTKPGESMGPYAPMTAAERDDDEHEPPSSWRDEND